MVRWLVPWFCHWCLVVLTEDTDLQAAVAHRELPQRVSLGGGARRCGSGLGGGGLLLHAHHQLRGAPTKDETPPAAGKEEERREALSLLLSPFIDLLIALVAGITAYRATGRTSSLKHKASVRLPR